MENLLYSHDENNHPRAILHNKVSEKSEEQEITKEITKEKQPLNDLNESTVEHIRGIQDQAIIDKKPNSPKKSFAEPTSDTSNFVTSMIEREIGRLAGDLFF